MEYLIILAVFFVLLVVVLFLPISMKKGPRVIVLSAGLIISLITTFLSIYIVWWQLILGTLLLMSAVGYFLIKHLPLQEETQSFSFIQSNEELVQMPIVTQKELHLEPIQPAPLEILEIDDELEMIFSFQSEKEEINLEKKSNQELEEIDFNDLTIMDSNKKDELY